jgi:diaminopimelate epimerase
VLTKSHGLGNDYLVADPADLPFEVTPERVRLLCDRHVGIGSDGLLLLQPDLGVRIINPDGSEAEKSGNGIRIFARWLVSTGRASAGPFVVGTLSGAVPVSVSGHEVTVDMGSPRFGDVTELQGIGHVVVVDIGNPHCVVPRDELDLAELRHLGPLIETHAAFPNRTNVQLARATSHDRLELLIWERGAGETQASGSSACAAFAALHRLGQVGARATASMPGGDLRVWLDDAHHIWQHGPVEEVARITLSADLIARLQALP